MQSYNELLLNLLPFRCCKIYYAKFIDCCVKIILFDAFPINMDPLCEIYHRFTIKPILIRNDFKAKHSIGDDA